MLFSIDIVAMDDANKLNAFISQYNANSLQPMYAKSSFFIFCTSNDLSKWQPKTCGARLLVVQMSESE